MCTTSFRWHCDRRCSTARRQFRTHERADQVKGGFLSGASDGVTEVRADEVLCLLYGHRSRREITPHNLIQEKALDAVVHIHIERQAAGSCEKPSTAAARPHYQLIRYSTHGAILCRSAGFDSHTLTNTSPINSWSIKNMKRNLKEKRTECRLAAPS